MMLWGEPANHPNWPDRSPRRLYDPRSAVSQSKPGGLIQHTSARLPDFLIDPKVSLSVQRTLVAYHLRRHGRVPGPGLAIHPLPDPKTLPATTSLACGRLIRRPCGPGHMASEDALCPAGPFGGFPVTRRQRDIRLQPTDGYRPKTITISWSIHPKVYRPPRLATPKGSCRSLPAKPICPKANYLCRPAGRSEEFPAIWPFTGRRHPKASPKVPDRETPSSPVARSGTRKLLPAKAGSNQRVLISRSSPAFLSPCR